MGTLNGLIKRIKLEEGYIEKASNNNLDSKTANKGSNNYTKYSRDVNNVGLMGCQAQPWCGTFQFAEELYEFGKDIALQNWGMNFKNYVGYNCFATYNAFKARGKVGMTPKIGALVIFNFSHMGRVLDIYSRNGRRYYHCAEGNTSANLNDRNGGQVKIKERLYDDLSTVKGFCYIDYKDADTTIEQKKSGWYQENNGWRFYLGDTGEYIKNDWYLHTNGRYTWFDGAGYAIHDTWYKYKNLWYYFAGDCYMISSQWLNYNGNQYYLTSDGSMATNAYVKSKDPKTNIYYWINNDGIYEPQWDTNNPDLTKYKLVI